jgi:hypothetical protein
MPLLLKCHEASILSSERIDRKLTFFEWITWCAHVVVCPACLLFHKQVMLLHRLSTKCGISSEEFGSEVHSELTGSIHDGEDQLIDTLSEDAKRRIRAIIST